MSDIVAPCGRRHGLRINSWHLWKTFVEDQQQGQSESLLMLFRGLTLIGLPDFRDGYGSFANNLMRTTLPRCTNLRTLSIRRVHTHSNIFNPHNYVSSLPLGITMSVPPTFTRFDLRLPFLPLDSLMYNLFRLKSPIKHISIDVGAWMQLSPEHNAGVKVNSTSLHDREIKRTAGTAARAVRFTTYEKSHDEVFDAEDKCGFHNPSSTITRLKKRAFLVRSSTRLIATSIAKTFKLLRFPMYRWKTVMDIEATDGPADAASMRVMKNKSTKTYWAQKSPQCRSCSAISITRHRNTQALLYQHWSLSGRK